MSDERKTIWCGNLSDKVTEELLYELFLQVAPLERVRIPTDKQGRKSNYGFVTLKHEASVKYAVELLNGTPLYNREINLKPRVVDLPQPKPLNSKVNQDSIIEELTKLGQALNHNYNSNSEHNQRNYSGPSDRRRDNYKPYHQRHEYNHNRQGRNGQYGGGHRNYDRNRRQYY